MTVRRRHTSANEDAGASGLLFTGLLLLALQREPVPTVEKMTPSCLCSHIATSIWNTALSNDLSSLYLPCEGAATSATGSAELLRSYLAALWPASTSRRGFCDVMSHRHMRQMWYRGGSLFEFMFFHLARSHKQTIMITPVRWWIHFPSPWNRNQYIWLIVSTKIFSLSSH